MEKEIFEEYLSIREEIDAQCTKLWEQHNSYMQCKNGCSSCCQSFKVLPVELHAIIEGIGSDEIEHHTEEQEGACAFLINNSCSIYNWRPVICRTHGYPLVRLNEETESYEISFCDLNFKKFSLDQFHMANVYQEDLYTSKLYMLNKKFIAGYSKVKYDSLELLNLNELAKK